MNIGYHQILVWQDDDDEIPVSSPCTNSANWRQALNMLHVCAVSDSDSDPEKRSPMCMLGSLQHAISNRLCRSRPCYQTSTDSYLVRSCASIRFWKPLKASQVMQGMYLPRKTSSKDAYAKAYAPSRIKFLHQTSTSASNRSKNEPLISFSPSCEI